MSASIVARADGIARQKDAPGAVFARGRQREPEAARFLAKELVRHLDQDAGAVAGVDFAAARAAMQEVDEQLKRLLDDGVRAHAFDVDDEPDAAGVFFVARVIESLRRRATRFAIHKEGLVIGYTSHK